jgi:hypothetical protein
MANIMINLKLKSKVRALGIFFFLIIFSCLSTNLLAGSLNISWTPVIDSQLSGYRVKYGTQPSNLAQSVDVGNLTSSILPNLTAGTTYYASVVAYDSSSVEGTASVPVWAVVLDGSSIPATSVGATSAVVAWQTVKPSSSQVEYGTSTSYGSSTPLDSAMVADHAQTLNKLLPATTWHFRVRSQDAGGASVISADYTFTTTKVSAVNAGGIAIGSFADDVYFSSGNLVSTTAAINTTGVVAPAPQSVYQSGRGGANFSYSFPKFNPGVSYKVRLHFAETYWTRTSQRKFNVSINGASALKDFDIMAAAGLPNKAVVKEFLVVASNTGQILVQFSQGTVDLAIISGIEVVPAAEVPSAWLYQDVGSVGKKGSVAFANGQFTVNGAGAQIWGQTDAFYYVYQPLSADGEIVARVVSLQNTNLRAKAALMIRETLDSNSRFAMITRSPATVPEFDYRIETGGICDNALGVTGKPFWIKIVRTGNVFSGYQSTDGVNWLPVGEQYVAMGQNVSVGLAVTSHQSTILTKAVFDNVAVKLAP